MLKELGKLFGSENKVKVLRYFLANQDAQTTVTDLIKKLKINKTELKKELKNLVSINFLTEIVLVDTIEIKIKGKKGKAGKVKIRETKEEGYELGKDYVFTDSLANLLLDYRHIDKQDLQDDFKKYGKIKLLCLGGVFVRDEEGTLDLLVVGDALDKDKIDNYVKKMEADYGTELRYAVFESEEFRYRVNMFDRLLKDFWKRPHTKVVEKISSHP